MAEAAGVEASGIHLIEGMLGCFFSVSYLSDGTPDMALWSIPSRPSQRGGTALPGRAFGGDIGGLMNKAALVNTYITGTGQQTKSGTVENVCLNTSHVSCQRVSLEQIAPT